MRPSFGVILAVGTWLAAMPANAQTYDPRYPVCMHIFTGGFGGGGDYFDCSFTSLRQCQASAAGRSASCDVNPYFAPDQSGRRRARRGY